MFRINYIVVVKTNPLNEYLGAIFYATRGLNIFLHAFILLFKVLFPFLLTCESLIVLDLKVKEHETEWLSVGCRTNYANMCHEPDNSRGSNAHMEYFHLDINSIFYFIVFHYSDLTL